MRSAAALTRLGAVVGLTAALAMGGAAAPAAACACGGFVSSDANASPSDEVALIHWDGRDQTMIMQLGLRSDADDAALVVPTPTPATASAASAELFTELRELTAPRVERPWKWLPQMGFGSEAAGAPSGASAPTVLAQVQLGPIEATTLAGGDMTGLTSWLSRHGYVMRPQMLASLAPYSREGWSFVAMRLTSPEPLDGSLDPVKLVFGSDRLVYPMRMSVVATDEQRVRVYAVSDHRLRRTEPADDGQYTDYPFAGWVSNVRDADLARMIGDRAFLTEMRVSIYDPSKILSDFTFRRAPQDVEYRAVVYDPVDVSGYVTLAVLLWVALTIALVVVGLAAWLVHPRRSA